MRCESHSPPPLARVQQSVIALISTNNSANRDRDHDVYNHDYTHPSTSKNGQHLGFLAISAYVIG